MESPSFMERLEFLLLKLELPVVLMKKDELVPFDQILIALDEGEVEKPKYILKLLVVEEVLTTADEQGEPLDPALIDQFTPLQTLQLYLEFPLRLNPKKLLDTYRLVSAFSSMIPIGSLTLNEGEGQSVVFYSHTIQSDQGAFPIAPLVETIDVITFFLNRLLPQVVDFVKTPKGIKQAFEDVQQVFAG